MKIDNQKEYSVREAAELLGVDKRTVYRYIDFGWMDVQIFPSGTIRINGQAIIHFKETSYFRAREKNNCQEQLVFNF